jgi:hypothetical protein
MHFICIIIFIFLYFSIYIYLFKFLKFEPFDIFYRGAVIRYLLLETAKTNLIQISNVN